MLDACETLSAACVSDAAKDNSRERKMDCTVRNGVALAAADALSVSEASLQRMKQRGCGTSRSDRKAMSMPDLKAFAYPLASKIPTEILAGDGANTMSRDGQPINTQGFVPPFANESRPYADDLRDTTLLGQILTPPTDGAVTPSNFAQRSNNIIAGQLASPGGAFAGTGDLTQLNKSTFGTSPGVYDQIAAGLLGERVEAKREEETTPYIIEAAETENLGYVASDTVQQLSTNPPRVYGTNAKTSNSFLQNCKTSLCGFSYDLLHYPNASRALYASAHKNTRYPNDIVPIQHARTILRLAQRDGRAPHLLFTAVGAVLSILIGWMLYRSLVPAALQQQPPTVLYTQNFIPSAFQYPPTTTYQTQAPVKPLAFGQIVSEPYLPGQVLMRQQ